MALNMMRNVTRNVTRNMASNVAFKQVNTPRNVTRNTARNVTRTGLQASMICDTGFNAAYKTKRLMPTNHLRFFWAWPNRNAAKHSFALTAETRAKLKDYYTVVVVGCTVIGTGTGALIGVREAYSDWYTEYPRWTRKTLDGDSPLPYQIMWLGLGACVHLSGAFIWITGHMLCGAIAGVTFGVFAPAFFPLGCLVKAASLRRA